MDQKREEPQEPDLAQRGLAWAREHYTDDTDAPAREQSILNGEPMEDCAQVPDCSAEQMEARGRAGLPVAGPARLHQLIVEGFASLAKADRGAEATSRSPRMAVDLMNREQELEHAAETAASFRAQYEGDRARRWPEIPAKGGTFARDTFVMGMLYRWYEVEHANAGLSPEVIMRAVTFAFFGHLQDLADGT